jgi:hypothetical protein
MVQRVTGLVVMTHWQHGSPSSCPFVWPSPSESAMHSALVHTLLALLNALPKAFVAEDRPVPSVCPIAATPGTLAPLGILAT